MRRREPRGEWRGLAVRWAGGRQGRTGLAKAGSRFQVVARTQCQLLRPPFLPRGFARLRPVPQIHTTVSPPDVSMHGVNFLSTPSLRGPCHFRPPQSLSPESLGGFASTPLSSPNACNPLPRPPSTHTHAPSRSYQRLLEASRNWIRQEDLEAAINRALDNPEPFGFVTSLKINRGF